MIERCRGSRWHWGIITLNRSVVDERRTMTTMMIQAMITVTLREGVLQTAGAAGGEAGARARQFALLR